MVKGHLYLIHAVIFFDDGSLLVLFFDDEMVGLWDFATRILCG